jgi:hypothetical protein
MVELIITLRAELTGPGVPLMFAQQKSALLLVMSSSRFLTCINRLRI